MSPGCLSARRPTQNAATVSSVTQPELAALPYIRPIMREVSDYASRISERLLCCLSTRVMLRRKPSRVRHVTLNGAPSIGRRQLLCTFLVRSQEEYGIAQSVKWALDLYHSRDHISLGDKLEKSGGGVFFFLASAHLPIVTRRR